MASIDISTADLSALNVAGKSVVLTGGSTGIGAATIKLLHSLGARIVFGDVNSTAGQALAAEFADRVTFHLTDVSWFVSQRALFNEAVRQHGRIDYVFANAGVSRKDALLDDVLDENGELAEPDLADLGVNLHGVLYTAKLAVHHFRRQTGGGALVLTGSAASYLDTPPLWVYTAAKHGVLGLMRGLRSGLDEAEGISVSMVAPWYTKTALGKESLEARWGDRPKNDPEGVAKALVLAAGQGRASNGKAYWVGGNEVVEMEDQIRATRGAWLTESMAEKVNEGQKALGGW